MHSASAQTGKASEIVSVYMLTKCLQDNNSRHGHAQTKASQDHTIKSSASTYDGSASYE